MTKTGINKSIKRLILPVSIVLVIISVIALTASFALPILNHQEVQAPQWETGDWWSYEVIDEDGRFLFLGQAEQMLMYAYDLRTTVLGQAEVSGKSYYIVEYRFTTDYGPMFEIIYSDVDTLSYYHTLESYFLEAMEEFGIQPQSYSFPLEERKSWQVAPDHIAVVVGREKIEVPAGKQTAYRIEHVADGVQWTLWYSARVENVVRSYGREVKMALSDWGHQSDSVTLDQLLIDLQFMAQWDPAMAIIQADTLINHGIDSERIVQFKDELKRQLNEGKKIEGYRDSG